MAEYLTKEQAARKAEQEADEMVAYAIETTPEKYRKYLMVMSRNQNFNPRGSKGQEVWATIRTPFMKADGRIRMARDHHLSAGAILSHTTDYYQVGDQYVCRVTATSALHGTIQAHGNVTFGGKGVDESNPLEAAETAALARALRFMGYGVFGSDPDNSYDPTERQSGDAQDIPDMSGTPESEQEPKGEPASEKQIGMLYGLLKQSGVHDGHKSKLVERIFPGGITKREASVAISLLKDVGRLWDVWAEQYIRLLAEENSTSTKEVATWMREKFGTLAVNDISSEQLRTLLAWITGDMEDIPEPVYTPGEPVHEPSAGDWAQLVAGICQGAGVSLDDLSAWAIESYSTVPGIDDMAMLGSSVYDKLRSASSDLDWIKEQVTEFSTQKPLL